MKIVKLSPDAITPSYAHPHDSGLDLYAIADDIILPGESRLIGTGISIQLDKGTEGQIRPRSGLALNHQVTVLNTPGTIDEGYRGEIGVILINHGKSPFRVEKGMRIAQMVIAPVIRVIIEEVTSLGESQRGLGGFGSTGF